jgi:hypothetical protein
MKRHQEEKIRVDFSLRREVLFVVIGAVVGAIFMVVPRMVFEAGMGLPYYVSWIAFGHVVGIYSSFSVVGGITIHMITAICIGIVIGIFLYKSGILNISKISNGLIYGLFSGIVVFVVFFIPVSQFVLAPEIARTVTVMIPSMTQIDAAVGIRLSIIIVLFNISLTNDIHNISFGYRHIKVYLLDIYKIWKLD